MGVFIFILRSINREKACLSRGDEKVVVFGAEREEDSTFEKIHNAERFLH